MKEPVENIVAQQEPKPEDWLNAKEIQRELRCSYEHVRAICGKRGGPVLLAHFYYNGRLWATRKTVAEYKIRVVMNSIMKGKHGRA